MFARPVGPLGLLLLAACSSDAADPQRVATRDSLGITITESMLDAATPVCTISEEPSLTIGTVGGPPEYQLYRTFGAARLADGRIAVVNQGSQELRFYDSAGTYLMGSGRAGDGPGEFRNAFILFVLPGDTLWVGDYRPWAWEIFAPDGRWVRSVSPQPPYINTGSHGVLDDGRMVVTVSDVVEAPTNRFEPRQMMVALHSPDGALIDTVGVFDNGLQGRFEDVPNFVASPMFDASARMAAAGSRMIIGYTARPELQVYEVEDIPRLDRIIRWNGEERRVTDADVAAERQRIRDAYADADPAMHQRLVDPQIRADRPVAERFPAYSSLVIGRDGRIWIRSYRLPGAEGPAEWLIFRRDGELECRLSIEGFEQMPDFGSDYILVMKRDALGVERIHRYSLHPPQQPQ